MRKIAVVTGARADYGYLVPILERIQKDRSLTLQLLVTGMHLSPRHGLTAREIRRDGFPVAARIPLPLSDDSPAGTAIATAVALAGFARAFARLKPDLLVVLGDRFEVLAAAAAALPFRLPVAHIHGGESSEGAIDESIRHALTKLSHLHFPARPEYARRIRRMGEDPRRVLCFGSPSWDRIRSLAGLSRKALEIDLGLRLVAPVGVVTFHPETLSGDAGAASLRSLLSALSAAPGTWVFTEPNADAGGRGLARQIRRFAAARRGRAKSFAALGQRRYFSLLRHADVMLGNSSSALLEAPYFRLPAVNVGDRQRGRVKPANVLDAPRARHVAGALRRALSPAFRRSLARRLPGLPKASPSAAIVRTLKSVALGPDLIKKSFHEG